MKITISNLKKLINEELKKIILEEEEEEDEDELYQLDSNKYEKLELNDNRILKGHFNLISLDINDTPIRVINSKSTDGCAGNPPNKPGSIEQYKWCLEAFEYLTNEDYPEEDDEIQTYKWIIYGPNGELVKEGPLISWEDGEKEYLTVGD